MADLLTPAPDGTDIGVLIDDQFYGRNLLFDATGADAMGTADTTPGANTLLGRIKAIADAIVARLPTLGAKAASGSVSVTPSSDGFGVVDTQSAPAAVAAAITPHDTNALATVTRGIYVGGGGDITVRMAGAASDSVYKNVPVGALLPIKVSHVRATGTTATFLLGLS